MAQSRTEQKAEELAATVRQEHGLGDAPIADMFEFASHACRVDVLSLNAPAVEHGASMTDPTTGRTAIAVATTNNPMRQRSSIAHELGHYLANHLDGLRDPPVGTRSPEEKLADTFARHLLLPQDWLRHTFEDHHPQLEDLSRIIQDFGVSPAMAAIQLRQTGVIDEQICKEWCKLTTRQVAGQHGWLQQYEQMASASLQPRAPQRLVARAVAGYRAGLVPLAELANWYGVDPAELEGLFGPPQPQVDDDEDQDEDEDEAYWNSFGAIS